MEEAVYVIRLTKDTRLDSALFGGQSALSSTASKTASLPSEQRYSASLVLGLGTLHICFGVLSALFAVAALFVETEVNQYGTAIWTGMIYTGCGIMGILAYSRWYVRNQIVWFLFAAVLASMCSVTCLFITTLGVVQRRLRLQQEREYYLAAPFHSPFNEIKELRVTSVVTVNIYLVSLFELFWSLWSAKVAYEGSQAKEYCLYDSKTTGANKDGQQGQVVKKEFVLEASLPPGYSASGILANPDLLCHLRVPHSNQYHVTRANPLCEDVDGQGQRMQPDVIGGNGGNADVTDANDDAEVESRAANFVDDAHFQRERVHKFLSEAVEMAHRNATKTQGAAVSVVELNPDPIYGSAIA